MDDIVAFLKARLDDDEREANDWPGEMDCRWYKLPGHTPARVLRAVEAKRKLISDLLAQEHFLNDREWYGCRAVTAGRGDGPDQSTGEPCTCGRDEDVERRLRLLASEWTDHPDYRTEWANLSPFIDPSMRKGWAGANGPEPVVPWIASPGPEVLDTPAGHVVRAICPCLAWAVADIRTAVFPDGHHEACDGTGHRKDQP